MLGNHMHTHPSKKIPKSKFQPGKEYCKKAVDEYLKAGGKITKIEIKKESAVNFHPRDLLTVDEL